MDFESGSIAAMLKGAASSLMLAVLNKVCEECFLVLTNF